VFSNLEFKRYAINGSTDWCRPVEKHKYWEATHKGEKACIKGAIKALTRFHEEYSVLSRCEPPEKGLKQIC